jgi:hypothetical protein
VLRPVLADIDNAGAVAAPDGRAEVSSPHVARRESADAYDAAGQSERAAVLRTEADTLTSFR